MFFTIESNKYLNKEQQRAEILMSAYFIIKNYPLKASDTLLNNFLKQHYNDELKNLCIKILLNLIFYKDKDHFILSFKNPEIEKLARLITYGNGKVPGSQILQVALKR